MKTRKAKTERGEITLYFPENDADIDTLNRLLEEGKIQPPTLAAEPVVD